MDNTKAPTPCGHESCNCANAEKVSPYLVAQAERAVVDDETISRLLHLRSLVTAWALCQSAMDDLDKVGEVSDKASAEWNQWMSANRRAGDDLMAWCKADAERLVTSQVVAALDLARKGEA